MGKGDRSSGHYKDTHGFRHVDRYGGEACQDSTTSQMHHSRYLGIALNDGRGRGSGTAGMGSDTGYRRTRFSL